jgi:hypothetical protein
MPDGNPVVADVLAEAPSYFSAEKMLFGSSTCCGEFGTGSKRGGVSLNLMKALAMVGLRSIQYIILTARR